LYSTDKLLTFATFLSFGRVSRAAMFQKSRCQGADIRFLLASGLIQHILHEKFPRQGSPQVSEFQIPRSPSYIYCGAGRGDPPEWWKSFCVPLKHLRLHVIIASILKPPPPRPELRVTPPKVGNQLGSPKYHVANQYVRCRSADSGTIAYPAATSMEWPGLGGEAGELIAYHLNFSTLSF